MIFFCFQRTVWLLLIAILQVEQNCKNQMEANKKIEEDISVKEKTVKLIKNAPQNILTLKVISSFIYLRIVLSMVTFLDGSL